MNKTMRQKAGSVLLAFLMAFGNGSFTPAYAEETVEENASETAVPESEGEQQPLNTEMPGEDPVITADPLVSEDANNQEDFKADEEEPGEDDLQLLGEEGTDLTMENHSLEWIQGSSDTIISDDKTQLSITPNSNSSDASVKAKVTYSCGGNEGVEKGKAEIRIPKDVFFNRDGKAVGTVELSIPKAPSTGGSTSFNYAIEKGDDGLEYIVIRNYRDIPPGGFFMTADIVWKFNAVDVANGFSNNNVQASFFTQGQGGGDALTADSGKLSMDVSTTPKFSDAKKEATDKKENWQSEWGPAPENAGDYFYVQWYLEQKMGTSSSTSAYSLYLTESQEKLGQGTIVTWKDNGVGNRPTTYYLVDGKSPDQALGDDGALALMNSIPVTKVSTASEVRSAGKSSRTVIVKYPKTMVENATPTLSNEFTATYVTPENAQEQKVSLGKYVYQAVKTGVDYAGDAISSYKRANYYYTSLNSRTNSVNGGVNMLRNGVSVVASWSIDVKNMGWTRTENGTKTYDTVLRDGMMYIAGERLTGDDYDIIGFFPYQWDSYVPFYNEDKGDYLDLSKTYDEENFGVIKVEWKDKDGNWHNAGTLTKTGESNYHWVGTDGTVKDCGTSYSVADRIALPDGAKDIRYTHTGKTYGVEYRMGLFYSLHPTDHVMNLIGADTTSFDLVNISEAYGKQDDRIYTLGNFLGNTTTPGIKADVENSDADEFGGTDKVIHDYSTHRFNTISGTGSFSKNMGTPVNLPDEATVKIPVSLRWDYYFNYANLGVTSEEAIQSQIVKEAREAYFYDLLPIGTTVDLSSIKVHPYGYGEVVCDYTVELVNNWRDSGRTMMILNVKAPEDFVNYYVSPNYIDTGYIVNFDMYDSWDNINTNGSKLENNAAIYGMEGPVPGGVSDTGVGSADKTLFENLGGGGGNDGLENNVKYAKSNVTINVPTAAQLGFSKAVKGAADKAYSQDGTAVPATGAYSYQMRFSLRDKATANDVVMYDVLESAYGSNNKWNGVMTGIDINQIKRLYPNVNPVIYYSTSDRMKDLADGTGATDLTNLKDATIWSSDVPSDLSKVTAIAVDISKDKNGNSYKFEGPMSVAAEIFMEAPANYKDYIDNEETADVDETTYAYNKAYIKQGGQNMEGSNTVTVEVEKPKAEIAKKSDPVSGTPDNRTQVAYEEPLTYTLDVRNKNIADAMKQMTVEDVIPQGLEIQEAEISYYFGSALSTKTTVGVNKRVQAKIEGQKITFTIDNLAANEVVHLIIPTKAGVQARGQATFDNSAKITGFNGGEFEYTSNTTYHEGKPELIDLSVQKIWDDNNNAYGLRIPVTVEILADGIPTGNTLDLNEANQWKNTVTGLNKYSVDGATEIVYSIKETAVPGYPNPSYAKAADGTFTVTNTPVVEDQNGAVTFKIAKYKKGTNEKVPGVVFSLNAGTQKLDEQTTDANGEVTFTVNVDNNHGDYNLNVKEESVPNGYVKTDTPFAITLKKSDTPVYTATTDKIIRSYGWRVETSLALRNGAYVIENEYKPNPVSVPFTLSKKFADPTERLRDMTFTFNVTPEIDSADYPKPDKNSYTLTLPQGTSTSEVTTTGSIKFTKTGTYTYSFTEKVDGLPGVSYAMEQDGAKSSYTMTVTVTDVNGDLKASVSFNNQTLNNPTAAQLKALFVNKFEYEAVQITPVMEKAFTANSQPRPLDADGNVIEKDFEFVVEGMTGNGLKEPILPSQNGQMVNKLVVNGTGTGTLPTLTFKEPGTYKYKVTETPVTGDGYANYDRSYYVVTVEVEETTENSNKLEAGKVTMEHFNADGSKKEDTDSIRFTNEYIPLSTELQIPVQKIITGHARPSNREFTFVLKALNADSPLPANTELTINDEGEAKYDAITFTKAGTYYYVVTEEIPNNTGAYTYDRDAHIVTVEVTDINGQLSASWKLDDSTDVATVNTKVVFTNHYEPQPAELAIPVKKVIAGNVRPIEKTFEFELSDGVNSYTKTITGAGNTTFDPLVYTEAGTYTYTLSEKQGNEQGYTYSTDVKNLTIEVVDNNGVLEVTADSLAAVNETALTFTNQYKPDSTSVELELIKKFTDDSQNRPNAKDFTFTLSGPNVNETLTLTPDAGDHTKTKSGKFTAITYNEAGIYNYTITEDLTGLIGFTSDNPIASVTVTVTDNNGRLSVAVSSTEADKSVIINRYIPTPVSMDLNVQKVFHPDAQDRPNPKTFTFTVTPVGEGPRFTEQTTELEFEAGDSSETHQGGFGIVTFIAAGTYEYTIHEVNSSYVGYTFAADQTLTVEVVDNDGQLEIASRDLNGEDNNLAVMENDYQPIATSVTLKVQKQFLDDTDRPSEKTFEFEIFDGNDERIETIHTIGGGQAESRPLIFTKAGTFTYIIREVNGNEPGYTYDERDHVITITVTDLDGHLTPTFEIDGNENVEILPVVNTYKPKEAELVLSVEKIVKGTNAKDPFTFTLKAKGNNPMPQEDSVTIQGAGTVEFAPLTFTKIGTYVYELSEVKGKQRYTYDKTVHELVVTVIDNNGVLEASFTDNGAKVEHVTFTNVYRPVAVVNTGDSTNLLLYTSALAVALLGILLSLKVMKKGK